MEKNVFTTDDISKICGVTIQTVIGWEKQGKLPAYKTLGGHRRIKKEDLIVFLKKNKIPLPKEMAREWSCRILIIHGNKNTMNLISGFIKNKYPNRTICAATDGFEAGRQIILFKPDLVILGLKLPGSDAFEICEKIRTHQETKHIRVMAISDCYSIETEKKILASGADIFLPEQFKNQEFVAYLDNFKIK